MMHQDEWGPCRPGQLNEMVAGLQRTRRWTGLRSGLAVAALLALLVTGGVVVRQIVAQDIGCDRVVPRLQAYHNGALDPVSQVRIARHLKKCRGCRRHYEQLETNEDAQRPGTQVTRVLAFSD